MEDLVNLTKIIIAVFDGLQPTQIDQSVTPNIYGISEEGCFFENHHPVFPSVTRINAATMVTGVGPDVHGLPGNMLVARDFDSSRVISAMEPELAEIAASGVPILHTQTLQEVLNTVGMEYVAIGVGTSGNAYVHNPRGEQVGGATIHPEFSIPSKVHLELDKKYGKWPAQVIPNTPRYEHAMNIFLNYVLEERDPDVALIWSSEPDKSQHAYGVGAPESQRALHEADSQFGRLVERLQVSQKLRDCQVLILSDHGYSTIIKPINIEEELRNSELEAVLTARKILIAQNGGSALLYISDSDRDIAVQVVDWLVSREWCGTILASERLGDIEGTIPSSAVSYDGPRCPDLTISFKWNSERNAEGYMGKVYSTGGESGLGQHGSMSRHEMNNTLICQGTRFRGGERILSPSGNIDIMPTILELLDVPPPDSITGRVLRESFVGSDPEVISNTTEHKASTMSDLGLYSQRIVVSNIGNSIYLDEGNSRHELRGE